MVGSRLQLRLRSGGWSLRVVAGVSRHVMCEFCWVFVSNVRFGRMRCLDDELGVFEDCVDAE